MAALHPSRAVKDGTVLYGEGRGERIFFCLVFKEIADFTTNGGKRKMCIGNYEGKNEPIVLAPERNGMSSILLIRRAA